MKLFIFGSTGDLVKRKIIPAFIELRPKDLEIVALGRKEFTDELYYKFICDDDCLKDFKTKPIYHKLDFENDIICERCGDFLEENEINFFYIALPPRALEPVLAYIGGVQEAGYQVRVLAEKPFGESKKHAQELREQLQRYHLIDVFYISDHYLFKEGVHKLPLDTYRNLKIVSLEMVGLEQRAAYYDGIGALRDMVQSHFLNIIFRTLSNPQDEFENFSVKRYTPAQYGNGKDSGYVHELGHPSATETFAQVMLITKTKTYECITGKRFDRKVSYMEIDTTRIDLENSANAYVRLFDDFFKGNRESFVSIEHALLAWDITESIIKHADPLRYYPQGTSALQAAEGNIELLSV
ncbi:MAG: hypothetical protein M1320_02195 [Patescibacteria group bacterium]|nr:hypothetical protein [Patescibacteria group bacterium]